MAKARSRKARGHNGNPVDGRVSTVYVRQLTTYSTVVSGSNQFTLGIHPLNMGSRAVEFCDLFEEYRWMDLKVSFLSAYSSATTNAVMGMVGISASEALSAVPTTAAQISQFDTAHTTFLNQTTPIQVKLAREVLRGHQDWYSANTGADVPCVFSACGLSISTGLAVAGSIMVLWEGRIQFKGNSDPAVTISRRQLRDRTRIEDDAVNQIVARNHEKRVLVCS